MKLQDLINSKIFLHSKINISGLSENSKEIKKNYIFFLKDTLKTKESYIKEAIQKGASLIIYCKNNHIDINKYNDSCLFYKVNNINESMSNLARKFYKIKKLDAKIIGITGTNGKTSVSDFIGQLKKIKKEKCGIIGTSGSGIYPNLKNKELTTPNIININKNIRSFINKDAETITMEVSSHGIDQDRIRGVEFDTVVFTNLSQDHLDYHKTMSSYFNVKVKLFTEYKSKKKIICIDGTYGKKIYNILKKENNLLTVSINNNKADYYASDINFLDSGINFNINSEYGKRKISTKLYGKFSIINLLISIATVASNKKEYNLLIDNIGKIKHVNGRMNKYNSKGRPITFIDFAHTPEAINEVLISTKKHFINKKIITVFGCGGNRDSLKRKLMGKVVSNNSDKIIITNDNPRNEEPKMIVNDIISGFKDITNHKIIFDRKKAIKKALELKNSENIVLILGKGNEEFQIVKNKKILHSDDKVVKKILKL